MGRINNLFCLNVPAVASWLLLAGLSASQCAAQDAFSGTPAKPTFTQSVKQSFNKMGDAISSKPKPGSLPEDDPTLLSSNAKPSVELYVSMGKYYEEVNKPNEAEQQYKMALKENKNNLLAMLTYAHFLENQDRYEDAVKFYQETIKAHPKEASVYNNLGLCHIRKKKIKEATTSLAQAVQLDPRNALYRNNIAALLVEQNRLSEAFDNLRRVHGDAKAYYNLGYLLCKKGNDEAAEHHFKQALLLDPSMDSAQRWLAYLQNKSQPPMERNFKVVHPAPTEINQPQEQVASRNTQPMSRQPINFIPPQRQTLQQQQQQQPDRTFIPTQKTYPEPTANPTIKQPKRLPPVVVRQPTGAMYSGSGADASDTAPDAPLPPESTAP